MFTPNLPVALTAASNSSKRFKQHKMLGGSAVSDVTAVAVTPSGPSGPAPEIMLTPPASRRIASRKSSALIVGSSSSVAVACILFTSCASGVDIESALAVTHLGISVCQLCARVNRFGDEVPTWGEKTTLARPSGLGAVPASAAERNSFPPSGEKNDPFGANPR